MVLSHDVSLKPITIKEQKKLFCLMQKIYPQTYQHLWEDGGEWYINKLYSLENVEKELSEPNTPYYFVLFRQEIVGILRIQNACLLPEYADQSASKLQRIYLDIKVQGKGVGKLLMDFTARQSKQYGSTILWLEVMDTQQVAIRFYEKMGYQIVGPASIELDLLYPHLRGMYKMCKTL